MPHRIEYSGSLDERSLTEIKYEKLQAYKGRACLFASADVHCSAHGGCSDGRCLCRHQKRSHGKREDNDDDALLHRPLRPAAYRLAKSQECCAVGGGRNETV